MLTPTNNCSKRSFLNQLFKFTSLVVLISFSTTSSAQLIKALSNGKIYTFDAKSPSKLIGNPVSLTGLGTGQTIVGMDYRPNTGELFCLGYNASKGTARLYLVNANGSLSIINFNDIKIELGNGPIGFDFNPTVDRIRVVSASNKNYRLNPTTGELSNTDADLNYITADINEGKNPFIGTCAYTNSYVAATSTALYVFDDSLNNFALQNPPNNGVLTTLSNNTNIVINTLDRSSDMDIYFDASTNSNKAFFATNPKETKNDNLYTIDLSTGSAALVGQIGTGLEIQDIAVLIERKVPNLSGHLIYGLTLTNAGANHNLISFSATNPSVIRTLTTLNGLKPGFTIIGMDYRVSDGQLYALAKKNTVDSALIYKINPVSGSSTLLKDTLLSLIVGNGPIGFDINPVNDRMRVVSSNTVQYTIDFDSLIVKTKDNLRYQNGDSNVSKQPFIGTIAYSNNYLGASSTQLFDIDDSLNTLAKQNFDLGLLNTVGRLGQLINTADASADMDIVSDKIQQSNTLYLAANTGTSNNDDLFSIDLATGKATIIGRIGFGSALKNIAAEVPRPPTAGIFKSPSVAFQLTVYPNPARNAANISFNLEEKAHSTVKLYDYSGKLIDVLIDKPLSGAQHLVIATESLAKGIYFITLTLNNESQQVSKLVVE